MVPKKLTLFALLVTLSAYGQSDGPAQLPLTVPNTRQSDTPSSNIPIYVPAGANLQAVLNTAIPGDTIVVDPQWTGSISTLPNGSFSTWITITTASRLIPDENTRISPAFAGTSTLPFRPGFTLPSTGTARLLPQITLLAAPIVGGNYVRIIGLEITRPVGSGPVSTLIRNLGHDIIWDRCWIHGTATDETTRGIDLSNSANVAVINSYFSDFHCRAFGTCTDSQAISGGLGGPGGPYLIQNNYLEASGENILFGGGGATATPEDITIRGNDLYKPMSWNPLDPSYAPTPDAKGVLRPWVVKNLFELKNADRVLFENNTLSNVWGGFTQVGEALTLTAKNQGSATGNLCPICEVTNVTVRNNHVSYASQALQIACAPSGSGGWPAVCGNYSIHDNVFDHLQYPTCSMCNSFLIEIAAGGPTLLQQVSVVNNKFLLDGTWLLPGPGFLATKANAALVLSAPITGAPGIHFDGNTFDAGNNGIYSSGGGAGNCATLAQSIQKMIASCWPDGTMTGNHIIQTLPIPKWRLPWPPGNTIN